MLGLSQFGLDSSENWSSWVRNVTSSLISIQKKLDLKSARVRFFSPIGFLAEAPKKRSRWQQRNKQACEESAISHSTGVLDSRPDLTICKFNLKYV